MKYYISVMTMEGEYAHVIEGSTLHGSMAAARALHVDSLSASRLTRPVLVTEDGRIASLGSDVTSFRDEEWTVEGWELPRHEGSTGRINVRQGVTHGSFFPSVFELDWLGLELLRRRRVAIPAQR